MLGQFRITGLRWPKGAPIAKWAPRIVIVLCAGLWTYFVTAVTLSEGRQALVPALFILIPMWAVAVIAWRWPRVGGSLLVGAGVFAAWYFHHPAPLSLMAIPLTTAGLAQLLWPVARRTVKPA